MTTLKPLGVEPVFLALEVVTAPFQNTHLIVAVLVQVELKDEDVEIGLRS